MPSLSVSACLIALTPNCQVANFEIRYIIFLTNTYDRLSAQDSVGCRFFVG